MNQPNLYRFGQLLSLIFLIVCFLNLVSFINSLLWYFGSTTSLVNNLVKISTWFFEIGILAVIVCIALKSDNLGLNKLGRIGAWIYAVAFLLNYLIIISNGFIIMKIDWDFIHMYVKIFSGVLLFFSFVILAGKTMLALGSHLSLLIKILIPSIGFFFILYEVFVGAFAGYLGGGEAMNTWVSGLHFIGSAVLFVFLLLWTRKQKNIQAGAI